MVYRIFVEKKGELAHEAISLKNELSSLLGIEALSGLRILCRYDVENIEKELFDYSVKTVFSEPQLDIATEKMENITDCKLFAVEFLPGQFDQRADSASQCIQIISKGDRPTVRTAKVYILSGNLTDEDVEKIKAYVINPVESREASLEKPETLETEFFIPETVETVNGFCELDDSGLEKVLREYGLAMDMADIKFCQNYFKSEDRDPTVTEIRVIDTYWSDHCRHTTFLTTIDSVTFEDEEIQKTYEDYLEARREIGRTKPVNLMDLGTIGARYLREKGLLKNLDESEEVNACTVKIKVNHDGNEEDWLLLFKNETHNHPTEIEPFGGAATCIGGAIRDPLSGRSYAYSAMRVTGAADPTVPIESTIKGKLPQRKIVTTAAAGYSSYGNQIGLATGQVTEIYHPGYVAKRMEIGAVMAAAPAENVRRERPSDGDIVILLGGKTGRDGCGGATGSSKSHTLESLENCGAEVQKGNAPEERKLQRLFRNPEVSKLILRCNDFGAGGVSVAIGELADGLKIDLNAVPKKYAGLDGTELAISESQERMAVVVSPKDAKLFMELAEKENIESSIVAVVTEEERLIMNWNGKDIVNLSREFVNSNGAEKHIDIAVTKPNSFEKVEAFDFKTSYKELVCDLNVCSQRGLVENFDSTIGTGTVLMPLGGKYQLTPIQSMVHKISTEHGDTDTCSYMSFGYNPFISEKSPYHGAYLAVIESVSKLIATGAEFSDVYLTFQEYFERLHRDPKRWGKPMAAILGAYRAQRELGIAAIGGKDSMSGSFEDIDVPPTLVSFAVTTGKTDEVISPEFKSANNEVYIVRPEYKNGMVDSESLLELFEKVTKLMRDGTVVSAYTPGYGGIAEAVFKMSIGNGIGFDFDENITISEIFDYAYGAFVLEVTEPIYFGTLLGTTLESPEITRKGEILKLSELLEGYEAKLEEIFPCNIKQSENTPQTFNYTAETRVSPIVKCIKPKALIPVFPGTNCEYDTAKALEKAGAEPEIFVINNLTSQSIAQSIEAFAEKVGKSQMIFIPGGFSGGDEPDGSGKFITAFFRNSAVKDSVHELLKKRDGLMGGICNGFQALIKLGLVPYGEIIDTDENCPTLTYNTISRHQSSIVRTRIASNKSPWFAETNVGDIYNVAISHGEGRFLASDELILKLAENGQILTQYADLDGNPSNNIRFNPNDSCFAVEGICSPDGRVFGKMGHSERIGDGLYKNIPGEFDMKLFESAVKYFEI